MKSERDSERDASRFVRAGGGERENQFARLLKIRLQHWRGFPGIYDLLTSQVLGFKVWMRARRAKNRPRCLHESSV